MNRKIRIAVQNSGRLMQPSLEFLRSLGLEFEPCERALLCSCKNTDIEILFVRNGDIPVYVNRNVADFGIVGENVLYENQFSLPVIKKLGFGICSLVIAAPKLSTIKTPDDLEGERIATSYSYSLQQYLKQKKVTASIINVRGSVESTPALGVADAICDITQTGETLEKNSLRIIDTLLESQAVLVASSEITKNLWTELQKRLTQKI